MVGDAYRFLIPLLILGLLSLLLPLPYRPISLLFFLAAAGVGWFFRNPDRTVPDGDQWIVSPADGRVIRISRSPGGEQTISIFMSVFNVHVNRSPIRGRLVDLEYKRGRFKAAYHDDAPRLNEQNILTIVGEGIKVTVRQVAGLIARRVVCWKKPGDSVERGEPIGLIRFGSRVDLVLPKDVQVMVQEGDRVRGGTSILGKR